MDSLLKSSLCSLLLLHSSVNKAEPSDVFSLSLQELLKVKIESAGKIPEEIREIPASVIIVTREEIASYGHSTLTDVLENVPGFYNIYSYEGVSGNFGIRGFWNPRSQNSNVAILVNGINQSRRDDRSNPLGKITVPVESIDRIEIIRGPMSVMYGNGASFGVINIITNEQTQSASQNSFNLGFGNNGTTKAHYRLNQNFDNYSVTSNIGFYQTDGLDPFIRDMVSSDVLPTLTSFGISDPETYSFDGFLEQISKYFDLTVSTEHWTVDLSYNRSTFEKLVLLPPVDQGTEEDIVNKMISLHYEKPLTDVISIDSRFVYNRFKRTQDFDALFVGFEGDNSIDYNDFNVETIMQYTPDNQLTLVAGLDYRVMEDFVEFTNAPLVGFINESVNIRKRQTYSLFTQVTYHVDENLSLISGFRHEKIKKYNRLGIENGGTPQEASFGGEQGGKTNNTPRLAAVYHFDSASTIKIMFGEASKMVEDRFSAESTQTAEFSYIYTSEHTKATASLFRNSLDDLVVNLLELQPDDSVRNRTLQSGKISTKGLELILFNQLNEHWSSELSLTYQDSENKLFPHIDLAYSPEKVIHGKLRYKQEDFIVALTGQFIDSMDTLFDSTIENQDMSFGARIGDSVPSYLVFNANFRLENLWNNGYLNLAVTNFTNEEIRYPNNQVNSEILTRGAIGAEREILLSIGWKF